MHTLHGRLVERRRWLVHDEYVRAAGEHAGDCGEPLLASAERERVPVGEVGDADEVERLLHALAHGGLIEPLVAWSIGHVLAHGGGEQLPFGALHDQAKRAA